MIQFPVQFLPNCHNWLGNADDDVTIVTHTREKWYLTRYIWILFAATGRVRNHVFKIVAYVRQETGSPLTEILDCYRSGASNDLNKRCGFVSRAFANKTHSSKILIGMENISLENAFQNIFCKIPFQGFEKSRIMFSRILRIKGCYIMFLFVIHQVLDCVGDTPPNTFGVERNGRYSTDDTFEINILHLLIKGNIDVCAMGIDIKWVLIVM